jgi:hypothetical protein
VALLDEETGDCLHCITAAKKVANQSCATFFASRVLGTDALVCLGWGGGGSLIFSVQDDVGYHGYESHQHCTVTAPFLLESHLP